MSSRDRILKKSSPSDGALPITSEDDLLGPGDGNSKIGQKSTLKAVKSRPKKLEADSAPNDASNSPTNDVIGSIDGKFLLAQMQKKDAQIESLTESVSCMTQEIQKLNNLILKLQEQVAKSQENNSSTSKGVHNIPFSKVLQPEGKKNGSLSEKTPLAKVPSVPAKKPVKFVDVVKRDVAKAQSVEIEEGVTEIQAASWKGKEL